MNTASLQASQIGMTSVHVQREKDFTKEQAREERMGHGVLFFVGI